MDVLGGREQGESFIESQVPTVVAGESKRQVPYGENGARRCIQERWQSRESGERGSFTLSIPFWVLLEY